MGRNKIMSVKFATTHLATEVYEVEPSCSARPSLAEDPNSAGSAEIIDSLLESCG